MFPHRPTVDEPDRDTCTVPLDSEEAAAICASLASETANEILSRLFEDPTTASELADDVDTSLQNAHYHLERLQEAGLVRIVDTWYSSRGVEMNVYAPAHDRFVIAPPSTDDAVDATERETDADESPPLVEPHSS